MTRTSNLQSLTYTMTPHEMRHQSHRADCPSKQPLPDSVQALTPWNLATRSSSLSSSAAV
jgi:hypothetical protein